MTFNQVLFIYIYLFIATNADPTMAKILHGNGTYQRGGGGIDDNSTVAQLYPAEEGNNMFDNESMTPCLLIALNNGGQHIKKKDSACKHDTSTQGKEIEDSGHSRLIQRVGDVRI